MDINPLVMKEFFKDDNGKLSSTRLVVVSMVGYAMALAAYTLHEEGSAAAIAVFSSISGIAAGWKMIQKNQEKKEN